MGEGTVSWQSRDFRGWRSLTVRRAPAGSSRCRTYTSSQTVDWSKKKRLQVRQKMKYTAAARYRTHHKQSFLKAPPCEKHCGQTLQTSVTHPAKIYPDPPRTVWHPPQKGTAKRQGSAFKESDGHISMRLFTANSRPCEPPICLFAYLPICLFAYSPICLFAYLPIRLFACLPVCPFVYSPR